MLLVLRHHPLIHLGLFQGSLQERNTPFQYLDAWTLDSDFPNPSNFSRIMILGGENSANDNLAYLCFELYLIEMAIREGVPLFGICLGSQLMAKAHGARVQLSQSPEIGWSPIELHGPAYQDPVFQGWNSRETVFQWHYESFDLPSGAELLASSMRCANQAFRYPPYNYGVQFHPEATPALIAGWLDQDVRELPAGLEVNPWANEARNAARSIAMLDQWLRLTEPS